ncbi:MAG: HipA domain-containing protein, partial [Treponema sp.]|nr:HipA domain-containing protein [Treponema sp.]
LKDCFNLIQEKFSDKLEQINIFLKSILFNYLIGNCDSHGKNFSLVFEDSKIKLSPLYDLVSTTVYPALTKKMAMKLGSNYEIEKITRNDFAKQAELFEIKNRFWVNVMEDFSKNLIPAFSEVSNMPEFSQCHELIELLHNQINTRLQVLL